MQWLYLFLPAGLTALASQLMKRDKNNTGADDAAANLIMQMQPLIPQLIEGNIDDNTADKVFLAIYRTSEAYLIQRSKLPPPRA